MKLSVYKPFHPTAMLGLCLLVGACATVTHHGVEDDVKDLGIRYYRSSPYLLVHSDGSGGIVTQILQLPDPQKKMSAKPKATLASLESTMEFDHGVLTNSDDKADATEVPKALAKAVEAVLPAIAKVFNQPTEDAPTVPGPLIFKIEMKGASVSFNGQTTSDSFHVTLLPQK